MLNIINNRQASHKHSYKKLVGYNCFDCLIYLFCQWYGISISPFFIDCFQFICTFDKNKSYDWKDSCIWHEISPKSIINLEDQGLHINFVKKDECVTSSIERVIKNGTPIGMEIFREDVYWDKHGMLFHDLHFITIISIEGKNAICADLFLLDDCFVLPLDFIKNSSRKFIIPSFMNSDVPLDIEKYRLDSLKHIKSLRHKASLKNFNDLIEVFINDKRLIAKIQDIYKIPLFYDIANTGWKRAHYAKFLSFLNECDPRDNNIFIISKTNDLSKKWHVLGQIFAKMMFSGNAEQYGKKLMDLFHIIRVDELFLLDELIKSLSNN